MKEWLAKKTLKRELAFAVFLFWFLITKRMFWDVLPDNIAAYMPLYTMASILMWGFISGAFGMDHITKYLERKAGV